jgi:hypothetical protein
MKRFILSLTVTMLLFLVINFSCQKADNGNLVSPTAASVKSSPNAVQPRFNLEVILRGEGKHFGHVKFRQDNDADKIISLETWVRDLEPNREYLLQRAVDAKNQVDGNCTSTAWLTLGKGTVPQSILTDANGTGREDLWRSVAVLNSGDAFDIHFQVIDKLTGEVVLVSDCYQYVVR